MTRRLHIPRAARILPAALGLAVSAAAAAEFPAVDEYVALAAQMEAALRAADTNQVAAAYPALRATHFAVRAALDGARYRVEAAYQQPIPGAGGSDDPYIGAIARTKTADLNRSLSMLAIKDYLLIGEPPTGATAIRTLTNGVASTVAADTALATALAPFVGEMVPPRLVLEADGPASASPGEAVQIDCVLRNAGDRTAENVTLRIATTVRPEVQIVSLPPLPGQAETAHAFYLVLPKTAGPVGVVVSSGASNTGGAHVRVAITVE